MLYVVNQMQFTLAELLHFFISLGYFDELFYLCRHEATGLIQISGIKAKVGG